MIIDAKLNFGGISNGSIVAQTPAATSTTPSTDVIDLGVNAQAGGIRRMGAMTELFLVLINTGVALAGATLQVTLQTDSVVGFGSAINTTMTTGPLATWAVGQAIIIPVDNSQLKQFIRLLYSSGGTMTTIPGVKAFITDAPQDWYAYADAI